MRLFARPLADGERVDIGGLALRLKVNRRARRISVRIDARTGEAVAVSPSTRRLPEALAFAKSRKPWIVDHLARPPGAPRPEAGTRITVFGQPWELAPDGRRPRLQDGVLSGCGDGEVDTQLVVRAIRREALEHFRDRIDVHCRTLGVATPAVSVTDARTRWGSCTPPSRGGGGSIRLSWRLALAPRATSDYVAAHECAHLIEANHGPRFWALVRRLVGDPAPHRAFLRRHGSALHGFLAPRVDDLAA